MAWTEGEVAQELADLFELDTDRSNEGWLIHTRGYGPGEFALQQEDSTYTVIVEKVRG